MSFIEEIKLRKAAGFGAIKVSTRDEIACRQQLTEAAGGDDNICHIPLGKDFTGNAEIGVLVGWEDVIERDVRARRMLITWASRARKDGKLLVLLGPDEDVHEDLEGTFSIVRHPLPEPDLHADHFMSLVDQAGLQVDLPGALRSVRGLTSTRQEDAFALGIVDAKKRGLDEIDLAVLRRYKEQEIGDLGYLRMREPSIGFGDLIGHDYLKEWLTRRALGFTKKAREAGLPYPRGLLAVGPPGTGKSRLAEATAQEWGCPFVTLDIGAAMGRYLGESEANINYALEVAERVSPCVMLVDEVDYALGQGANDDGTTGRVIGKLLTWMATKTEPVFVFFTSNRPWLLPPPMVRKGRLDEIFCVDYPVTAERISIFRHYMGSVEDLFTADNVAEIFGSMEDWSGAEIEAVVHGARFKAFAEDRGPTSSDVVEEIEMTVPVSVSQKEEVAQMRNWAKKYARDSRRGAK